MMAPRAEQQWQLAQRLQRELQAKLKEKDALFEDVESLIQQLRITSESTIFLNFNYAVAQKVETHLWDAHSLINNRYRKIVSRFNGEEWKKHVVEKRKWDKRYADFLKTSQFFYKGYIQRLASHFSGLTELRKIAHRLHLSPLSANDPTKVSSETDHQILLSCHATLLRLGDLSRYRNVLRIKPRSWETAMTYYGLANDLCPQSGSAFNQMAVISLSEGDHLNAIYHLYRALAIEEPHPLAESNLEIEFKKITKEWANGGKRSAGSDTTTAKGNVVLPLVSWFVRLHAKLYKGEEFPGHDELENEVLSQTTVLLKEQSLEGILDKFVLINIAAEDFAAERLQLSSKNGVPSKELFQSYNFFLRLNVGMLFMLLQLLQPELAGSRDDVGAPDVTKHLIKAKPETITPVTRRILPALRQYSTWLSSRAEIICGKGENSPLSPHIKEMWSTYASTLSLLVINFPPENLLEVDYLLEEDAETVGLKPFRNSQFCKLYTNDDGRHKARISDPGVKRMPLEQENLARVRDLLRDGMVLAFNNKINGEKLAPIYLVGVKFQFHEEGLHMSSPNAESQSKIIQNMEILDNLDHLRTPDLSQIQREAAPRPASVARSDSHQSMSNDMYRMVDELVTPVPALKTKPPGGNETSYGMHSLTAAEVFAPTNSFSRPVSRQRVSPTIFPPLPGIYSSPFSPQPGELSNSSPDQPKTAVRLSITQTPLYQTRVAIHPVTGQIIEQNNGKRSDQNSDFLPRAKEAISTSQQNVPHMLQQQLSQQYNAVSSAAFSHPSSIYLGTPHGELLPNSQRGDLSQNGSTTYPGATDLDLLSMPEGSAWHENPRDWSGQMQTRKSRPGW